MRVVVARPAAEHLRARIGGRLERGRRPRRAVLADVLPHLADRALDGVGLRGQREVDRRLGEREPGLRQPDVLDRLGRGDGDRQRLRVGVPDVLRREDDHPPRDEPGVLAALEHRRQVVERRVRVRPARGLDPGRDVVVVLVAALVVENGLALHRVLGVGQRDLLVHRRARQLERVQRRPRIAVGARREELDHLVGHLGLRALAALDRAPQQRLEVLGRELLELVDLRAREQRAVDLEVRVLRRGADQRHEPVLDGRQQRVLLRLVEAVDLVEEEDRRAAALAPLGRAGDHLAHLGAPRLDRGELLERGVGVLGGEAGERRLPGPGRAVEDHRVRAAGLERGAQRGARSEQVLLADELVERGRPHPRGERAVGRQPVIRSFLGWVEQPLHPSIFAQPWDAPSLCPPSSANGGAWGWSASAARRCRWRCCASCAWSGGSGWTRASSRTPTRRRSCCPARPGPSWRSTARTAWPAAREPCSAGSRSSSPAC